METDLTNKCSCMERKDHGSKGAFENKMAVASVLIVEEMILLAQEWRDLKTWDPHFKKPTFV